MGFQSLLYWIGRGDRPSGTQKMLRMPCFNPCCIGLGVGTQFAIHGLAHLLRVSILVVLDWAWGRVPDEPARRRLDCVSILVVLDWAWGHHAWADRACRKMRFQSLLYWIGRGDVASRTVRARAGRVSILVVLDWAWGHPATTPASSRKHMFQSLLYWIGRGDAFSCAGVELRMYVSILVVLDWAWGLAHLPLYAGVLDVSILVVLDWAWGRARAALPSRRNTSFNPCCIGLGVGTVVGSSVVAAVTGFNPCCIGLGVGTLSPGDHSQTLPLFQSLLYWIGRGDRSGPAVPVGDHRRFNPCCIGLGVGTS